MTLLLLALLSVTLPATDSALDRPGVSAGVGLNEAPREFYELVDRDTYELGPGDVLRVVVEGGCTPAMLSAGLYPVSNVTVSGDGNLVVSGIGQVAVGGLTIQEAESALRELASRYYPRTTFSLSLTAPRVFIVRISGMVNEPGHFFMRSIDRTSALVDQAGGISAGGTRRGRLITADGDTLAVDLMLDPETGRPTADPLLSEQAVLEFGPSDSPVTVVRAPGAGALLPVETFDLGPTPGEVDIEGFSALVGGFQGNVDMAKSFLIRDGEYLPIWDGVDNEFLELTLQTDDTLRLASVTDSVVVSGAVYLPRSVAYVPGATVADYIGRAGGATSDAATGRVRLSRNGRLVERGGDALERIPLPGDDIEVPYSWLARNSDAISVFTSLVSASVLLYNAFSN